MIKNTIFIFGICLGFIGKFALATLSLPEYITVYDDQNGRPLFHRHVSKSYFYERGKGGPFEVKVEVTPRATFVDPLTPHLPMTISQTTTFIINSFLESRDPPERPKKPDCWNTFNLVRNSNSLDLKSLVSGEDLASIKAALSERARYKEKVKTLLLNTLKKETFKEEFVFKVTQDPLEDVFAFTVTLTGHETSPPEWTAEKRNSQKKRKRSSTKEREYLEVKRTYAHNLDNIRSKETFQLLLVSFLKSSIEEWHSSLSLILNKGTRNIPNY